MKLMDTGWLQSDQLIKALCNTLLHSLWQGILLAIVAGLIVVLTKRSRAQTRYNLLVSALLLFTAGAMATFALQLKSSAKASYPATQAAVFIPEAPANAVIVRGPA